MLEGYCLFNSKSQQLWELHDYDIKKKRFSSKKSSMLNPGYVPASKRPNWCKRCNKDKTPNYKCLDGGKDMCPFFGFCNATTKDYNLYYKALKGDKR